MSRELLKGKFVDAFKDELRMLSLDYKDVLVDDLVTAFQNRINVLMKTDSNMQILIFSRYFPLHL